MNNKLQKLGGVAAILEALAYIAGFTVTIALLTPDQAHPLNPTGKLAFLLENQALTQGLNLVIYVFFGIFLVVLALALHDRLKVSSPHLMQAATAFGLLWSGMVIASGMIANIGLDAIARIYRSNPEQATSVWLAIDAVQNGLGGGVEIVGGLWVLLVSRAALQSGKLPRALNYVGLVVGLSGILTAIPGLGDLAAVFGLSQIGWFIWLGTFMLQNSRSEPGA